MTTIPLSPIDHLFTGPGAYPIEFVFQYGETLDPALLGSGLAEVLPHFPPIEGSVRFDESGDRLVFDLERRHPIQLAVEHREAGLANWRDAENFLDPIDTSPERPLLSLRLTQTPSGSVLGVSFSHALGDGFSFFFFLSSWVKAVLGEEIQTPDHRRSLLIPESGALFPPVRSENSSSGFIFGEPREETDRASLRWERLLLSDAEICEMVARAGESGNRPLSANAVVTAFLWKMKVPEWSETSDREISRVHCPVDFRRIDRNVPRTYFGNAVVMAVAECGVGRLKDLTMAEAGERVQESIRRTRLDQVKKDLAVLESTLINEGTTGMERVHMIDPRNGLLVTNLSRLPLDELDFGSGKPTDIHIQTPATRGAVILPHSDGWDIRICQGKQGR